MIAVAAGELEGDVNGQFGAAAPAAPTAFAPRRPLAGGGVGGVGRALARGPRRAPTPIRSPPLGGAFALPASAGAASGRLGGLAPRGFLDRRGGDRRGGGDGQTHQTTGRDAHRSRPFGICPIEKAPSGRGVFPSPFYPRARPEPGQARQLLRSCRRTANFSSRSTDRTPGSRDLIRSEQPGGAAQEPGGLRELIGGATRPAGESERPGAEVRVGSRTARAASHWRRASDSSVRSAAAAVAVGQRSGASNRRPWTRSIWSRVDGQNQLVLFAVEPFVGQRGPRRVGLLTDGA